MNDSFEPLTLEPLLVERIWGEKSLHAWYPEPIAEKPIGEVWLTAENCVIKGSSATLAEAVEQSPDKFGVKNGEGFPLLIKILYPREKLSVQVHPNDAQAREMLGEPRGKTECWYVLSAEPGAELALGLNEDMDGPAMRASIADGTIEQKLRYLPVKAGDLVFVDAGTVHAIFPGMVVLETQQYSDVTYRLWDYGRPRELHLDSGIAVARSKTEAGLVSPTDMGGFTRLVSCPYFTVDTFKMNHAEEKTLGEEDNLQVVIALGDGAHLTNGEESYPLQAGCAVLLPKDGPAYKLAADQTIEVMRIFAPAV